jgi:hypothetical protein
MQTAGVFGETEVEASKARAEGEDAALSASHRPHRCTVLNCAKVHTRCYILLNIVRAAFINSTP